MDPLLRIILASDSPTWVRRMRTYLATIPEIEIVKAVAHGIDTLAACRQEQPDIVLVDIQSAPLPIGTLLIALHHFVPSLHVIGWTADYDGEVAAIVESTGAASYVTDPDMRQSLAQVLAVVMAGILWYSTLL